MKNSIMGALPGENLLSQRVFLTVNAISLNFPEKNIDAVPYRVSLFVKKNMLCPLKVPLQWKRNMKLCLMRKEKSQGSVMRCHIGYPPMENTLCSVP